MQNVLEVTSDLTLKKQQINIGRWYQDNDITEYLETLILHGGIGGMSLGATYLLRGRKEDGQFPASDGSSYIVAVTPAVNTMQKDMRIDYFLNKSKQPRNALADDLTLLLSSLKELDQSNYQNLTVQIAEKLKAATKDHIDIDTVKLLINELQKAGFDEAAIKARILEIDKAHSKYGYRDVFEEIMPILKRHKKGNSRILFPYNLDQRHWLTGEIMIAKKNNNYTVDIYAHDPYGHGQMAENLFNILELTIRARISQEHAEANLIEVHNQQSPFSARQAPGDNVSCGVIVCEDLSKRIRGEELPLASLYPIGTEGLRRQHIQAMIEYRAKQDPILEGFLARNLLKAESAVANKIHPHSPSLAVLPPLPKREFSRSTVVSLTSNALLLTGTGLGFFNTRGIQIAGAICNLTGFGAKQLHDYLENRNTRNEIAKKRRDIERNTVSKRLFNEVNNLYPEHWGNNYGVRVDWKDALTTLINIALQCAAVSLIWYNAETRKDTDDTLLKYFIMVAVVAAYGLDYLEQHFKKDNLRRYDERLSEVLKAETTSMSKRI